MGCDTANTPLHNTVVKQRVRSLTYLRRAGVARGRAYRKQGLDETAPVFYHEWDQCTSSPLRKKKKESSLPNIL